MITARTALLLALREGPSYGRELGRRLGRLTAGRLRLAEGSIYPALHRLEASHLVLSRTVVPGRRPGDRARTYYELTERGVRAAAGERADLLRLAGAAAPGLDPEATARMARRVELGAELSEAAFEIAIQTPRVRRGRGRVSARPTRFLRVARRVAEALGGEDCLLAGGFAVMAHGFVRGTRDVDVITRLPLTEARTRLAKRGLPTRLLRGNPLEGGFSCLKGECEGVPFDVLPQIVAIHWEAAPAVEARGAAKLRVVCLDDLLALKLKAGGARDLMDAAILVLLHRETEGRARELATACGALDKFETWLDDPRTRAQAREEAAFEARRSKPRSRTRR